MQVRNSDKSSSYAIKLQTLFCNFFYIQLGVKYQTLRNCENVLDETEIQKLRKKQLSVTNSLSFSLYTIFLNFQ